MRTLTKWEVEEFVSEVSQRRKLWFGRDKLWVRRNHSTGKNALAVKFLNGLAHDMSEMHVKSLDGTPDEESERYTEWLLSKFTSYGWRMKVEKYLKQLLPTEPLPLLELIARDVCSPSFGESSITLTTVLTTLPTIVAAALSVQGVGNVVTTPTPPRSKYLQKLLK